MVEWQKCHTNHQQGSASVLLLMTIWHTSGDEVAESTIRFEVHVPCKSSFATATMLVCQVRLQAENDLHA
jgi:hypothetical protein